MGSEYLAALAIEVKGPLPRLYGETKYGERLNSQNFRNQALGWRHDTWRAPVRPRSQNFVSVLSHQNSVFKLGRPLAILCQHCPAILLQVTVKIP